ncbi:hypothetical protein OSL00_23350, partial [Escherichia coli]|nr:hypothetical protein [Escherichia coli]
LKETTCWVERTIQMVNYCLISLALTYVSLPMIPLEISGISSRTLANTMHTMAARGYEYKERFPQMIRYRVKEWEKVAGVPVAEVF